MSWLNESGWKVVYKTETSHHPYKLFGTFLKSPSFVWLYFSWIAFLLLLFENTCKLSTKAKKLHKLSLLEISLRSISQSKHLEVNIIHIEFHWQFLITYSSFWLVILLRYFDASSKIAIKMIKTQIFDEKF